MELALTIHRSPKHPNEPGYYLTWHGAKVRPQVLHWSETRRAFVDCARVVPVQSWAGPLPEQRESML